MLDLKPEQIELIIKRQNYLESEILGIDPDSKGYILWTWGGSANFYKVNLWEYLNLGDFVQEANELEASQEICEKLIGEANTNEGQ